MILTTIFVILGSLDASSRSFCRVRSFDIYDGLPANNVSSVVEGENGLVWVLTWNGMSFYDGYGFTTFGDKNGDGPILSTNRVVSVKPLSNGNVWVITYDRNVYLLERSSGKFVDVGKMVSEKIGNEFAARNVYANDSISWISSHGKQVSVRVKNSGDLIKDDISVVMDAGGVPGSTVVRKVMMDDIGNEWIITDGGVKLYGSDVSVAGEFVDVVSIGDKSYLMAADGKLYVYDKVARNLSVRTLMKKGKRAYSIKRYKDDGLVIGTSDGVGVYNTTDGAFDEFKLDVPSNFAPYALYVDSKDRIWAFSNLDGIYMVNPEDRTSHCLQSYPDGTASIRGVRDIWHEDEYGTIWLVPTNGVFGSYDEESGRIVPQSIIPEFKNLNSFPVLERGMSDSQGNLWLTTTHGLILLNFRRNNMDFSPMVWNDEPRSVAQLPDNSIISGTSDGYLIVIGEDGRNRYFKHTAEGRYTLVDYPVKFASKIYAISIDSNDRVWVGTKGSGLFMLGKNGVAHRFVHNPSDKYSVSDDQIYDIDEDGQGNIWIATYGRGVNLLREETNGIFKFINVDNELKGYPTEDFYRVRRVTHDDNGVIYLSTTGGLVTFSNKMSSPDDMEFFTNRYKANNPHSIRTDIVMHTHVASDGSVYVATMGGGVQKIRSGVNPLSCDISFMQLKEAANSDHDLNQLPNGGSVWSIVEDRNGNICVIRETSIEVHSPSGDVTVFGPDDMQANLKFSEAKPIFDRESGELILSTLGGLLSIDVDKISKSGYTPNIIFTGVQFQGEKEMRTLLDSKSLEIEPRNRNLSISFAALDYSNNYLVRYAYRLDDDSRWTYLHNNHTVHLNNISPGKHKLTVRSTNGDGVWVDNESEIVLNVIPTFWETIWAKIMYVIVAGLVIWAVIHYYFMKKKHRLLHELRDEETRFYSDVGHKLRTPLTLIGSPVGEVLRTESLSEQGRSHLERVHRSATNMLSLVDAMIKKNHKEDVYVSDSVVPLKTQVSVGRDMPDDGVVETAREKLLVVEDNDDLRSYLYDILSSQYNVSIAENGKSGLEKAELIQPDFIITDVTMPEMDGLTMVRNIKRNKALSHIPIIVLSAKASEQDRIMGLKEGIDDYITKPFSAIYLRQRVASIIAQRKTLQQMYLESLREKYPLSASENVQTQPEETTEKAFSVPEQESQSSQEIEMTDADKKMIDELLTYTYSRLEDENLRIEDLADAVGLGRTVFYGKIKSLLGVTPSDFLRNIRMQRAEKLISETSMTFSEIAFSVGFSDPKYFTKCFKKDTGLTPSEYRKKNKKVSLA